MAHSKVSIFRVKALQRYLTRRDETVFPKLVPPRVFFFLWIMFSLLIIGCVLVVLAEVPVYVPAVAVVMETKSLNNGNSGAAIMAVFLPAEKLSKLRAGQKVLVKLNKSGELMIRPIFAVEPRIVSPKTFQNYFALSSGVAVKINEAKAIAFVTFQPASNQISVTNYIGSFYEAEVEIGSCRLISFFNDCATSLRDNK